ncbi:MAG: hypothetical protein V4613_14900 [Bacteroidota bacterium]
MQRFLVLVVMLISSVSVYAQKPKPKSDGADNKDLSKYLDDGRIGNVSNLVRFRVGRAFSGYLGLSYERKFSRKFGLEGGAYYKVFKGNYVESESFPSIAYEQKLGSINGGTNFLIYPKLYISGKKINTGYFYGLRVLNFNYKADVVNNFYTMPNPIIQKDVKATATTLAITCGSHQHIASRFIFGLEMGYGLGWGTYKDLKYLQTDSSTGNQVLSSKGEDTKFSIDVFTIDISLGMLF